MESSAVEICCVLDLITNYTDTGNHLDNMAGDECSAPLDVLITWQGMNVRLQWTF